MRKTPEEDESPVAAPPSEPQDAGDLPRCLAVLRAVCGLTKDDLAKAAGIWPSAISEYERGRREPELATVRRLLAAMGFSLGALDRTRDYLNDLWRETGGPGTVAPPRPTDGPGALREIDAAALALGRATARVARLGLLLARPQEGEGREPGP